MTGKKIMVKNTFVIPHAALIASQINFPTTPNIKKIKIENQEEENDKNGKKENEEKNIDLNKKNNNIENQNNIEKTEDEKINENNKQNIENKQLKEEGNDNKSKNKKRRKKGKHGNPPKKNNKVDTDNIDEEEEIINENKKSNDEDFSKIILIYPWDNFKDVLLSKIYFDRKDRHQKLDKITSRILNYYIFKNIIFEIVNKEKIISIIIY